MPLRGYCRSGSWWDCVPPYESSRVANDRGRRNKGGPERPWGTFPTCQTRWKRVPHTLLAVLRVPLKGNNSMSGWRLSPAIVVLSLCTPAWAADAPVGVVCNVKVLSDKVEDVSSSRPGGGRSSSDGHDRPGEGARGLGDGRQVPPPGQPAQRVPPGEGNVHDPIKTFNVYGYGMCCCAACNIEALARSVGLQARGRIINAHSVPEVCWDGAWHLLDASLINYFTQGRRRARLGGRDRRGPEGLVRSTRFQGRRQQALPVHDRRRLEEGPALLANCPFYDENGWLPAATHGWYSTMQEYDGRPTGSTSTATRGLPGQHPAPPRRAADPQLVQQGPARQHGRRRRARAASTARSARTIFAMRRSTATSPRPHRQRHARVRRARWPTARSARVRWQAENLACKADDGQGPAVHVGRRAKPGMLVDPHAQQLRLPQRPARPEGRRRRGRQHRRPFSDNNGLDWKDVARLEKSGEQKIDLGSSVYRRYDYRLKFVLRGTGTGLESLRDSARHPALAAAAAGPGRGREHDHLLRRPAGGHDHHRREHQPGDEAASNWSRRLPRRARRRGQTTAARRRQGPGDGHVPGRRRPATWSACARLPLPRPRRARRLGRAGLLRRRQDVQDLDRFAGPTPGTCKYITVDDVPPGTTAALVRFAGTQRNTTCIFAYRIDADYREPGGGFRPVKVTYTWLENGRVRRDVHVAEKPQETYKITCEASPVMKSIELELADGPEQAK